MTDPLATLTRMRAVDDPVIGERFPPIHYPGIDDLAGEKARAFRRLMKDVEAFYRRNLPHASAESDAIASLVEAYASIGADLAEEQRRREMSEASP